MPADLITLKALTTELNGLLAEGRIDKITQPAPLDVVIALRAGGSNYNLLISVNPSMPRLHITKARFTNPINAPAFCMHLRKHLSGGKLVGVSVLGDDRIIDLKIVSKTELKDSVEFHLIAELMGRYSNLLLVSEGYITECMKHISLDESRLYRLLMPSIKYELPVSDKLPITDVEAIRTSLTSTSSADAAKLLSTTVSGISYQTAAEIVIRICPTPCVLDEASATSIVRLIEEFYQINGTSLYAPGVILDGQGVPTDYTVTEYSSLGGNYRRTESLNAACDAFFTAKYTQTALSGKVSRVKTVVDKQIQKNKKKLALINNKLLDAEQTELYKSYGDAIINNIYLIDKGSEVQKLNDYSVSPPAVISVPYNVYLSPSVNAERYYAKYQKLKRTGISNLEQRTQVLEQLEYLNSIAFSLSKVTDKAELPDIEQELIQAGFLKEKQDKKKNKNKKVRYQPMTPLTFTIDGFTVLVGKNNLQNELVTFSLAESADLWLHAKGYHSAHTVIKTGGRAVPDEVLLAAAQRTAFYSEASSSGKVEVDYTLRKYVKRHPAGKTGLVVYTNFNSLTVLPIKE